MERITVRDLLGKEIDIDVYDDVCEELAIAFCGPVKLTDEGKNVYSEVLDCAVEINDGDTACPYAVVLIGGLGWNRRLKMAKDLFESAAGYCGVEKYKKVFEEE